MGWRNEHAVAPIVGVIMLLGSTIVLGAGIWFIASGLSEGDLDTQYSVPSVLKADDGSALYVTLIAGESVPLDRARLQVSIDGVAAEYPMTVYANEVRDGKTWRAGDHLCVVGRLPGCLVNSGNTVSAQIVVHETLIWKGSWLLNPWSIDSSGTLVSHCAGPVFVDVLGTSITYGAGGPDIPVRVDLDSGNGFEPLFGGDPVAGGESYNIAWSTLGTEFRLQGRADYLSFHASYASGIGDDHVLVLLDGDPVPDIPAYGNQAGIEDFLTSYIDVASGTVTLDPSQAILLFEFTSNLASPAADWQDLVVVVDFEGPLCDA
ncbi:MAG: hypothetical protein ACPHK8_00030 [Thermoplasmatota archaeon]